MSTTSPELSSPPCPTPTPPWGPTFEGLIEVLLPKDNPQVMDGTGVELHAEDDVSGRAPELLVVALQLGGKDRREVRSQGASWSAPLAEPKGPPQTPERAVTKQELRTLWGRFYDSRETCGNKTVLPTDRLECRFEGQQRGLKLELRGVLVPSRELGGNSSH